MNYEKEIIDSVLSSKDVVSFTDANIKTTDFKDGHYAELIHFITNFIQEYQTFPTNDVVSTHSENYLATKIKNPELVKERTYKFKNTEKPTSFLISKVRDGNLREVIKGKMLDVVKSLADPLSDPLSVYMDGLKNISNEDSSKEIIKMSDFIDFGIDLEKRMTGEIDELGYPFDIKSMDKSIGGIKPGTFGVIIGRPGTGKSFFASILLSKLFTLGVNSYFISPEMGGKLPQRRLQTSLFNLDYDQFSDCQAFKDIISEDEWNTRNWLTQDSLSEPRKFLNKPQLDILQKKLRALDAFQKDVGGEVTINDKMTGPELTKENIEALILRSQASANPIKVLIIDGFHLINGGDGKTISTDWGSFMATSQRIKSLVNKYKIAIIVVHQAKKGDYGLQIEQNHSAYGDSLYQDCDWMIGLANNRELKKEKKMLTRIIKSRNGESIDFLMNWNPSTSVFSFKEEVDIDELDGGQTEIKPGFGQKQSAFAPIGNSL